MDDLRIGGHTIPAAELEETFETSGGPGGQHANKTETAVRLRFDISDSSLPDDVRARLIDQLGKSVEVTSAESRSQWRNRSIVRSRLQEKLETALKPEPKRKPTRPTRASKQRRLATKKAHGEKKQLRRTPKPDD